MLIEHIGKTLKTNNYYELSDEHYENIVNEILYKGDIEGVRENLLKFKNGGTKLSQVNNYYFKDLMFDTKLYHSKWSISEVLQSKELMGYFYYKTLDNKKIFPDTDSDGRKIQTAFRLGGKGVALKPSNFPIKTVDYILENYNVNGNYYDPSCGWGVRLLGSLRKNINYYGCDPNTILCDRLNQLVKEYEDVNGLNCEVTINPHGSEIFVPEWENKMGLCFTSPPYFNLEDYRHGEQSWTEGTSYDDWLNEYLNPTLENIKRYLINDGYVLFNVSDFNGLSLVADTISAFEKVGFKHIETLDLKNIKRTNSKGGHNDNSEGILVFKLKG